MRTHSSHLAPGTICLFALLLCTTNLRSEEVDFSREVAPIIAERCLDCHGGREPEGGLDLSSRERAFAGGDSGVVLVSGQPEESLLWQRIADNEMPPKHPLPDAEKEILKQWIDAGATWVGDRIDPFAVTTGKRAGYDWWSLQPVNTPATPEEFRDLHPIDAFVRARLVEHGLEPSPRADPRTLIRRLSFDLRGLPPTPEEVEAFLADDSDSAWEAVVERMLASPDYGERWARHWLDLARFGESQGFERDKIRDNAWPYRDWVIQALNEDLPFDQFARLQIAGDVLHPGDADATTATGFLVAGPYDEVGQSQQSAAMRAVVRQDEMEDYIGTVSQTFLGLTVNCARCHDHKFDPITQTEYYQLAAALAGVKPGERVLPADESRRQLANAQQSLKMVNDRIAGLLEPVRERLLSERRQAAAATPSPEPIARWTFETDLQDEVGSLHGTAHGGATIRDGQLVLDGKQAYVSTASLSVPLRDMTLEAWVRLDSLDQRGGGVLSVQSTDGHVFDAIVYGEKQPNQWMAGSNGFVRWKSFDGPAEQEANDALVHIAITYDSEGTIRGFRNGAPYGQAYRSDGPVTYQPGTSQILFGLRHGTAAGGNRMLAGRIEQAHLYDKALSPEEIASSAARFPVVSRQQLLAALTDDQRAALAEWEAEASELTGRVKSLSDRRVYVVSPRKAEVTHVLLRGNPATPAEEVGAGGIGALRGLSNDFSLPPDAAEGERRKKLAEWMTSAQNPLFARVIVNRLWHYHFGTGIVSSPNDFGFNGARPTHPELLDYLARELIANNWSLKALHRLIVTSETYRQSSKPDAAKLEVDAENRWLWRYAPQRLEAEVIRDTLLKVSGRLNSFRGGPSFRNFETFVHNSQFYIMQDREGPEYHRRTIYRMWIRSGRNRLLDAFDCPDPSVTTPDRVVTTTPTQSLSLLNNSFVLRMADALEERVLQEAAESLDAQVIEVYRLTLQRAPFEDEQRLAVLFVRQHGLAALARVLFNTNEFLFAE